VVETPARNCEPGKVLEGGLVSAAHRVRDCSDDASSSIVCRRSQPQLDARAVALDRRGDLIYDASSRTLHRSACPRLDDLTLLTSVPAGSALELVWAPTICACGPDVTVTVGLG
jgi:hypothetical protein